ncbi:hypothetical protein EIP91_009321 [Steccherinum ochraceum]|uniref:Uncharacterized protein n=1 Tax=Steccherinum ochraceum TaxID=92696 RepID=A0A4R0R763_9APHY|nr:hypothetical protein EIP91_009321 [Steccherinum ochraceum]
MAVSIGTAQPEDHPSPLHLVMSDDDFAFAFLEICDAQTIYRLQRCCRPFCAATRRYCSSRFHLRRLTANRFFTETQTAALRRLLRQTNAFIGGSQAVSLFSRQTFHTADLDIYVDHRTASAWSQFFTRVCDYNFIPKRDQPARWEEALELEHWTVSIYQEIGTVLDFKLRRNESDWNVQLIVIPNTVSPLSSVLRYHSTAVMCFITADVAYCLFPRATICNRRSMVLDTVHQRGRCEEAYNKYRQRGWTVEFREDILDDDIERMFRPGERWVGDGLTWRIQFGEDRGHAVRPEEDTPIAECTTRIGPVLQASAFRLETDPQAVIKWEDLSHPRLYYTHAVGEVSDELLQWLTATTSDGEYIDSLLVSHLVSQR